MFVDTFIKRPILASVCSLVIILAGLIAIPTLPIAQFPDLAPPTVNVSAFYNGASAETVETAVTTPLEQSINGVEGMMYMTSSSGNDGSCSITVTFDINRNIDIAAVDVQNRISQVTGRLPNEVNAVGISVTKASNNFVLGAGVYAQNGEYDALFMSNYIDRFIKDDLKRVPGVGDVLIFGERKYAMRLWLDPERLAGRGITAEEVVSALREQNVQVAAGQVGQPPAREGQTFQISVRAVGRLTEASEFDNIILKRTPDGTLVRVKDVGRSELGAETYTSDLRYNGRPAVGFGVLQLPSANQLNVYSNVMAELARLRLRFPPGMKAELAFDTTSVVSESIREVVTTLLEAIGLVILVMFLFLQNWRTTLIPAITIPVSLIGTFAFVKLFGFSINTLTLFGITLATGLVVDDAIVVIENIERHIHEYHRPPAEAASSAMSEVTSAVIATALVLAAVFIPVAFFPGTTGRLYQQFALTIAVSMAISAFNALTLTPALAGAAARESGEAEGCLLPRREPRDRGEHVGPGLDAARARARARRGHARVRRAPRPHVSGVHAGAHRLRARRRSGIHLHPRAGADRRVARLHDEHRETGRGRAAEDARSSAHLRRRRIQLRRIESELRRHVRDAERFSRPAGRGARGEGGRRQAVRRVQPDHRRAWSSRSCRRRSTGSARSAASPTSCRINRAARSKAWRPPRKA